MAGRAKKPVGAVVQREIGLQPDWQVIVREHGPAVWQSCYRLLGNEADAADCFQETFMCVLEVSRCQEVRSFRSLLVKVATSRSINRLRRRLRESECRSNGWQGVACSNPGPSEQAERRELVWRLRRALGKLGGQEAEVFCLRYFNGLSYREIAKEAGIGTSTVGVLLHRARAKLRAMLEGEQSVEKVRSDDEQKER